MNRDDEDVQKRMMGRFDDEDDNSKSETSSKDSDNGEDSDKWVSVENVKSDYPARQFYLNPDLVDRLDDEYKRLQYVADYDFGKDRHFYPVVVLAGLERLQELEGDEFKELLERLE